MTDRQTDRQTDRHINRITIASTRSALYLLSRVTIIKCDAYLPEFSSKQKWYIFYGRRRRRSAHIHVLSISFVLHRLLDVLAGRTEHKGIRGYVLVDGNDQPHNFKCMTGYVVQVGHDTAASSASSYTFNYIVSNLNSY